VPGKLAILCWTVLPLGVMAQSVALSVGSGSAAAGGTAALAINIASASGAQVSAVQWSFSYSPDIVSFSVTAASSATGAQKSITCAGQSCVAYGMNNQAIPDGTLAIMTVTLASSPSGPAIPVQISMVAAASPNGASVPATASSGVISVLPTSAVLNGLACTAITVSTPGNTTCTVTLGSPAPAAGYSVALSSSSTSLAAPAVVIVAAGNTTVNFTAMANQLSVDQTVTITSSAAGIAQTAILNLLAPVGVSSVSCVFPTLAGTGSTLCTASLTKAPAGPLTVLLYSNNAVLTVPASLTVQPGQTAVNFQVSAGTVGAAQAAIVTGSLNSAPNETFTLSINLAPAAIPAVAAGGILNAASFATGADGGQAPVAPGSLVSIFGTNLATAAVTANTLPLPAILGGVSVAFNGVPAALAFVTGAQINAQVPFELLTAGVESIAAGVVVTVNGVSSNLAPVQIVANAPGVFSVPAGAGNAILLSSADGSLAAPPTQSVLCGCSTRPIHPGENALLYVTGLGPVAPAIMDGFGDLVQIHTADTTPVVLIGGIQAQVVFAGQAPQFPGVDQINLVIPSNAPAGDSVPIQVQSGGITSTAMVTVAIGPQP
jgi:trimeric autotransporter adhesin